MSSKIKLLIPLSATLLVLIAVLVVKDKNHNEKAAEDAGKKYESIVNKNNQPEYTESRVAVDEQTTPTPLPPVKTQGSVDEIVSGMDEDLSSETTVAASGDSDIETLNQESSSINSNDIYNANQY